MLEEVYYRKWYIEKRKELGKYKEVSREIWKKNKSRS